VWDRSYHWQRQLRFAAGAVVLLLLVIASVALANTDAAQRTMQGARDLASEMFAADRHTIRVEVPAVLDARIGSLVYHDRPDGQAEVVGRVVRIQAEHERLVKLEIRLSSTAIAGTHRGGIVRGAPAALSMREAVELLVSPNTASDEALRARDAIWPVVRSDLLPGIVNGLIREVGEGIADPNSEDAALFARLVESLHAKLEPLETDLVNRLAKRAWDIVGVQGLAGGIFRLKENQAPEKAPEQSQQQEKDEAEGPQQGQDKNVEKESVDEPTEPGLAVTTKLMDWWSWINRAAEVKTDPAGKPFLSEETSKALKLALEEEVISFWQQNRARIVEAFQSSIDERRADFEQAFAQRWSKVLQDRVLMPAWEAGQARVMAAVEAYIRDFADRCLLTRERGPRLLFAFILRSYLDISDAPLLVYSPDADAKSDQVIYRPLLR